MILTLRYLQGYNILLLALRYLQYFSIILVTTIFLGLQYDITWV